jgi:hypothetical protein
MKPGQAIYTAASEESALRRRFYRQWFDSKRFGGRTLIGICFVTLSGADTCPDVGVRIWL